MMIDIQSVSKTYGSKHALSDIGISIPAQSCYGLLGPNGAGKSTLMKILAGIVLDYSGEIVIDGQGLRKNLTSLQKRIGYVPQDISLEPTLSARDNLLFFGRMYGLRGAHLKEQVDQVLNIVGLTERQKDNIATYSGGMKRRINIGSALMHKPEILIMDEPTVGVDPQSRNYIFELIQRLKAQGTTILYSSHYMEEIQTLCDSLALIDEGKVVESGSIQDIRKRHTTPSIYIEGDGLAAERLEAYGKVRPHKNGFMIETESTLSAMQRLSTDMQQRGQSLERLEITQSSLEDIFLKLTGSTLRDSA